LLVGSVAKGVHLTGTEIDIFVAFPADTPREVLEREGLALGDVLERPVRMYAEHPYTRGWYGGFEVEVVPCYRITDATPRMSSIVRPLGRSRNPSWSSIPWTRTGTSRAPSAWSRWRRSCMPRGHTSRRRANGSSSRGL